MKVILIQPPLVQLNAPYPSGAYLSAFFKELGHDVRWRDLSISLFYKIFSGTGLKRLFALSSERALLMADKAEKSGDEATAFNLRRYVSNADSWILWIDVITAILRGNSREKEHEFLFSPFAPRGSRMEGFLAGLGREPAVDDVRFLCSYALVDLADYITAVFDENFSLVRYAESLTVDESSFSEIENKIDSPVMKEFYEQVLQEELVSFTDFVSGSASEHFKEHYKERFIVGISVPFGGTFMPALYTARFFKKHFGSRAYVVLGGGFVNTELREVSERALSNYIDAISYDRGYGGYCEFLGRVGGVTVPAAERTPASECSPSAPATEDALSVPIVPIYKFRQFTAAGVIEPDWKGRHEIIETENRFTRELVPDFSDIDFSIYPRLCDDKNPMQRLWSDGAWIKAYLAHGCYWHKCAFCDTQLDYVCGYQPADVERLYKGLQENAQKNHIYGVHFVDEALPPLALKKFALLNASAQGGAILSAGAGVGTGGSAFSAGAGVGAGGTVPSARDVIVAGKICDEQKDAPTCKNDFASCSAPPAPLYFWGNVRFEKAFTYDLAALLSYGGLGGVSAGLEVATGDGLKNINKGTDIDSIVSACAAFKENGILVHAYMIYGFWNDTPQSIINSMETLRQLFAAGLLDSAFWHKFILTKNSRVMQEWEQGKHPELKPVFPRGSENRTIFAGNCLHFEGEKRFSKFGAPLDNALSSWMQGRRLDMPVRKWFNFDVPSPAIPKNFIETAISRYEKRKSEPVKEIAGREIYWLGSRPVLCSPHSAKKSQNERYAWFYMQEAVEQALNPNLAETLWKLSPKSDAVERKSALAEIKKSAKLLNEIQTLRGLGLVVL